MNDDVAAVADAPALDAKHIAELGRQLTELLRLRTLPIGMKLFADEAEMAKVPGLRRPTEGKTFSTCQLVTQARIAGFTLGITTANVPGFSNCGGVIGLNEPSELYLSGRKFEGVWFQNREAANKYQAEMPRVPPRYAGLVVSPLRSARVLASSRGRMSARPNGPPLWAMARWKSPLAMGLVMRYVTLTAPADSPNIVTLSGSPPNAAILSRTQPSAKTWSRSP
mgnify:CR=1 FL=1